MTAIGNLVLGYRTHYVFSNDFPSKYNAPSVYGSRLYIKFDVFKNGLFGFAYNIDRENSNGSYAHAVNTQSLLGYFYFGM